MTSPSDTTPTATVDKSAVGDLLRAYVGDDDATAMLDIDPAMFSTKRPAERDQTQPPPTIPPVPSPAPPSWARNATPAETGPFDPKSLERFFDAELQAAQPQATPKALPIKADDGVPESVRRARAAVVEVRKRERDEMLLSFLTDPLINDYLND